MEDFYEKISTIEKGQRFVLGIDGLSRSGKSTFVKKIKKHLKEFDIPICIFHIDDYIVEKKRRYNTDYEQWYEYYHLQWDVEYLKENFFRKLKTFSELTLQKYDCSTDVQELKVVNVPKSCLIIIEGVFIQRSEWRDFFDYMIFLDCSRDKRFNRESADTQRNIEKFQNRYWKAEEYYLKKVKPKQQANLVIEN
ncbi:AAA family ATPase [Bacillus shivajii]|uniref:kinase n=1 Tax=Bacillus shivajii TaxID=1983719 RepID=UPI001CFB4387|nr:kinase [Bacillus shivajii]UCZ54917.1 AAA family ATPase [Bacillus shivajii]